MTTPETIQIVILLMLMVSGLSLAGRKIGLPLPIVMTVGGLFLSMLPDFPEITMNPELVFLIFLPPLLYIAGANTSWRDFRLSLRAIVLMATGLVICTTFAIAWVAVSVIPGMTWPVAILLGAIISPPDAVAATAIAQKMKLPKRVITILEGESLMNDATSLVIYKICIAAILSGSLSMASAVPDFFAIGGGGIVIGLIVGFVFVQLRKMIDDPNIEIILSLMTPFASYLVAEEMHYSGVLAVVTTGLYVGIHLPHITSSKSRLVGYTVWETIIYALNNIVFLLIGLQLSTVVETLREYALSDLLLYAAAITVVMMAVRMAWVFPGAYLPRVLSKRIREHEKRPLPNGVAFVGWAGMRGVVSLAAAMAIPISLPDGSAFPMRDMVVFLTFAVIIFTLVVQGMTLPRVAKFLRLRHDNSEQHEEFMARRASLQMAIDKIDHHKNTQSHHKSVLEAIEGDYNLRLESLHSPNESQEDFQMHACIEAHHDLHQQLLELQRQAVLDLRQTKKIGDEVMRRLIRELDLEELRHKSG